jgi:hypothetical protein
MVKKIAKAVQRSLVMLLALAREDAARHFVRLYPPGLRVPSLDPSGLEPCDC